MADIHEGIAADQREHRVECGVEYPEILWFYDQRLANLVFKVAIRGRQTQEIAETDLLEWPEQRVAMRSQCAVAALPWERRLWEMADGAIQNRLAIAFDHDAGQSDPLDLQPADRLAHHER